MENKRIPIPQKTRFEVFKRDRFTCQYCGRSAPNVVLEVDHINPVANGGTNEIMNLITSCKECNRGKGKRVLTDETVVNKQMSQLKDLSERREQLEMITQWRDELRKVKDKELKIACDEFLKSTGQNIFCYKPDREKMKSLLSEFTLPEVLDALDIAADKYYTERSYYYAKAVLKKIGGICYNKRNQTKRDYYYNYLRKCCIDRFHGYDETMLRKIVSQIKDDEGFEYVKADLKIRTNMVDFYYGNYDTMIDELDGDNYEGSK